jgi:hypothetical protein
VQFAEAALAQVQWEKLFAERLRLESTCRSTALLVMRPHQVLLMMQTFQKSGIALSVACLPEPIKRILQYLQKLNHTKLI